MDEGACMSVERIFSTLFSIHSPDNLCDISSIFYSLSSSVSMLAVEEYEEMQVNLELEKDLRKKAESFAQEVSILQGPCFLFF